MLSAAVLLLGLAGLSGAPGLGSAARAAGPLIQPGEYVETETGGCTLGFVFDGTGKFAGNVYVSLAAHCVAVRGVGEQAKLYDGTVIGTATVVGNASIDTTDYAFIKVRPEVVSRVSGAVKGHPQYPKGYTTSGETALGDMVQVSGNAAGTELSTITQEERQAVLMFDNAERAGLTGPIWWGDSGGGLVHIKTGKALALVSRLCIAEPCESVNPTIEGILAKASARGFTVQLRTV